MKPDGERRLTGRHVLYWLLGFFGIVAVVNAVMIWLALTTHHEVVKRTLMIDTPPSSTVVVTRTIEREQDRG